MVTLRRAYLCSSFPTAFPGFFRPQPPPKSKPPPLSLLPLSFCTRAQTTHQSNTQVSKQWEAKRGKSYPKVRRRQSTSRQECNLA
uniref:Uncharacterized protein n=1 Tax=Arundo donax TaxID=35708 RepID=A0A0A9GCA6_ARUDO